VNDASFTSFSEGNLARAKWLIVNADDFGASSGVNRGIIEAHERGIVTSTSMMVDERASEHAATMIDDLPNLSVGLHVRLTDEHARPLFDLRDRTAVTSELRRQLDRFRELVRRDPAHLDSHHNVHVLPQVAQPFRGLADSFGVVLRGCSPIRYFPGFYGQWDGETHLEHIGVESLLGMLERELEEGITELGCHPGYVDSSLDSTYAIERETEIGSLVDPRVRRTLDDLGVRLVDSIAARAILAGDAMVGSQGTGG
jgi:chitin disaccharide deacetylase